MPEPGHRPGAAGYVHLYLDSKTISIAPVASNDSVTDQTIGRVKPGRHTSR
jgi:hypothetical protein